MKQQLPQPALQKALERALAHAEKPKLCRCLWIIIIDKTQLVLRSKPARFAGQRRVELKATLGLMRLAQLQRLARFAGQLKVRR